MNKYYFTFESLGQLFHGGWVIVFARNEHEATEKFIKRYGKKAFDPLRHLNFNRIFPSSVFERLPICRHGINGNFCQDVIF